ncbi:MAG: tRNA (adenosine(37)-N6)-dimethylallyltransferase MiaA [Aestuariivita sp.]|nr:tRNA (adenosine(37)-N6)-dimethylallyltransferase MiaA [Aestuariivita sp.]
MINLSSIPYDKHVLIAGPTASGKSEFALKIAQQQGGIIVNADASQVYSCWRLLTARPTVDMEAKCPHKLFGHILWSEAYSVGHWLRELAPLLSTNKRLIIVGGTGLYFSALVEGLNDIPSIPLNVRKYANCLTHSRMLSELDPLTIKQIDTKNRARVQRAWEVNYATGKSLSVWQSAKPTPLLPLKSVTALLINAPRDWLSLQILKRFDLMIENGVIDEVSHMISLYNPHLPAFKPIGLLELMAFTKGEISFNCARERIHIATCQFAKRQQTWFRKRMSDWHFANTKNLCLTERT